ncbi:hypothetical protein [Collinsella sp. An7]|uniref:hypothetical protein n=1 Tax=Collinsella sp. An7 TaxID=1965651 RepID=UPI00117F733B|nr:hypothetical protein [Collinsella sp. An7]
MEKKNEKSNTLRDIKEIAGGLSVVAVAIVFVIFIVARLMGIDTDNLDLGIFGAILGLPIVVWAILHFFLDYLEYFVRTYSGLIIGGAFILLIISVLADVRVGREIALPMSSISLLFLAGVMLILRWYIRSRDAVTDKVRNITICRAKDKTDCIQINNFSFDRIENVVITYVAEQLRTGTYANTSAGEMINDKNKRIKIRFLNRGSYQMKVPDSWSSLIETICLQAGNDDRCRLYEVAFQADGKSWIKRGGISGSVVTEINESPLQYYPAASIPDDWSEALSVV